MFDDSQGFVTRAFLRAELELEFRAYAGGGEDAVLLERLRAWDKRKRLSEVQAEGAFTQTFFVDTWGYGEAGRVAPDLQTIVPKLRIGGEGAGGGAGEADLALGWFRGRLDATPQVLCEFKDIRSKLDAKQNRKGSNRSPVEQCLNYIRGARRGLFGNEPVQPWWGIVTDMNEFRLYWWDRAPAEYLRFTIHRDDLFAGSYDLLTESADAQFDRFLFWKLFQRDYLLSTAGRPPLLRLIERQWVRERKLEGEFYDRYKGVRERLFNVLRVNNPGFAGTATELLRMSQALLDRFIFAFYCEDMGERMLFPPQMIRDHLKQRSTEPYYDPNGPEFWQFFKRLFAFMNDGGKFGGLPVPHINGGLFAPDPAIDALDIPNHVFAAPKQGAGPAMLESDPDTLLYLCASYNYAARGDAKESLSLYTLGRIFEQSITELEYRAGELEGRETIAKLSKRKRDGVYYTPEWVVNLLVEQTLGPWFAAVKKESGYPDEEQGAPGRAAAEAYVARLKLVRIVDPACGSGAFLISAFRRLLLERIAAELDVERAKAGAILPAISEPPLIADILANNIYGVDINPASVEIAKLALWLHSARAEAPLSSLDHTLRCGNSLVGHDFWIGRAKNDADVERINSFDWKEAFPEVWPDEVAGGFDIVLGNPPYVKLQNLVKVDPDVVGYLRANRGDDTYLSAQTGNFDLYLPFIEKGLRLLALEGKMAYIAPSLWTVNEYGEGLRKLVRRRRNLDRWLDFKAHQIFDEAITYTALQFFTKEARDEIRIATASGGETEAHDVDWSDDDLAVPYGAMSEDGEWLMATGAERALIDRLARDCLRLRDKKLTKEIFQGVKTGADPIFKLKKKSRGRYIYKPGSVSQFEVDIEDSLMKPILSGDEAKRYITPETDIYVLFPYTSNGKILPPEIMERDFPKGFSYLNRWKRELLERDNGRINADEWYRFSRSQSLNKLGFPKLYAAGTVPSLRLAFDSKGEFVLTGGRVDGIVPKKASDILYLLGVLNGVVADFVFRRIGRPKQGGWFEANKQFIAPLPVPNASERDRAKVSARALALQEGGTRRRDLLEAGEARLGVLARARHPARWLWPDLPALPDVIEAAPKALKSAGDRRDWAVRRLDELEAIRVEALQAALDGGGSLDCAFRDGELRLLADGVPVLSNIFLGDVAGALAESYWRWLLLTKAWREADRFATELRRPPAEAVSPAATQFMEHVLVMADLRSTIEASESAMNEHLYELYGLSADERLLVDNDFARRPVR